MVTFRVEIRVQMPEENQQIAQGETNGRTVNRAAGVSRAEVDTDIPVCTRKTGGAGANIGRLGGVVGTGGAKLAGLSSRGAVIDLANAGEGDIDISALAGVRILHEGGAGEARETRKRAASIVERDGDVGSGRSGTFTS